MTSRPLTLTQRRRLRAAERRAQAAQEAYDRAPKGMKLIRWVRLRDLRTKAVGEGGTP